MAKIREIYDNTIKDNGNRQVVYPITKAQAVYTDTNQKIQDLLNEGYRFGGLAKPNGVPSVKQRIFYVASTPGYYPNYGGLTIDGGESAFLLCDGTTWEKVAFSGTGNKNLTGYKTLANTSLLPDEESTLGYLIDNNLYVWVGEGGDTAGGKYENCGHLDGASAYEVAVQEGFSGTEEEWLESLVGPIGPTGKSAYQSAVDNGFEGTEADWVYLMTKASRDMTVVETELEDVVHHVDSGTLEDLEDPSAYATRDEYNELRTKIDGMSTGKYYGFHVSEEDLPEATDPGYAYVGESAPYALWNFDGLEWKDSGVTVDNAPVGNEEDIDQDEAGLLKLADRPTSSNQMGYVILRKNKTFAEQVTQENTIYEIRYEFDLGGASVTIPAGCVLKFDGGSLSNGKVINSDTLIDSSSRCFKKIKLLGHILNDKINVVWFGAKDDYATISQDYTNNDIPFSEAIASCKETLCTFYVPQNKNKYYYFTTPLVFNANFDVDICGSLIYDGAANSEAVTIGNTNGTNNKPKLFSIRYLSQKQQPTATIDLSTYTATCVDNIGVKILNVNNAQINIYNVSNFIYGVVVASDGGHGCCYNKFNFDLILNAYKGVVLTSNNDGWTNENMFVGGRIICYDSNQFYNVSRAICITSKDEDGYNNSNTFIKQCVENNYIGMEVEYGRYNQFLFQRTEGVTYSLLTKNDSTSNYAIPYNPLRGSVLEKGAYIGNNSFGLSDIATTNYNLIFNINEFEWAKASTISIKHLLFNNSLARFTSSLQVEDGIIKVSGAYIYVAIPIYFSTTNENKKLILNYYGQSAIGCIAFDANGDEIKDPSKVRVNLATSYYESISGMISLVSQKELGLHTIKIDVASEVNQLNLFFGTITISGNQELRLGKISLYSNTNAICPTQQDDNIYLNNKPVSAHPNVKRVIHYTNYYSTSYAAVTHWDLINSNWIPSLHYGPTSKRPTNELNVNCVGYKYEDSTLNKSIFFAHNSTFKRTVRVEGSGVTDVVVPNPFALNDRGSFTLQFTAQGSRTFIGCSFVKRETDNYKSADAIIIRDQDTLNTDVVPFDCPDPSVYPYIAVHRSSTMTNSVVFDFYKEDYSWVDAQGNPADAAKSGTTRPTNLTSNNVGFEFFDTTLGKPIYWNSTAWVDATGTPV